jgi:protein-L-isoaspartate O-methyltransferase
MALQKYTSLASMLTDLKNLMGADAAANSVIRASEFYWSGGIVDGLTRSDPFSEGYQQKCLELYSTVSGRSTYDPHQNELAPYVDAERSVSLPSPYNLHDSVAISDFFLSWGWILRNLSVRAGNSILEYGAGEGQLSLALARMGCDVSVIDIEPRCLDAIKKQAEALRVNVQLKLGEFGDSFDGRKFDRIVFFEAFHHALGHQKVLARLHDQLTADGFILFSGEPILKRGELQEAIVPFPWGPRLDGLSIWSSHLHGWCELGFQEGYFVDALMRAGWLVRSSPCSLSPRGNCYMAYPNRGKLDLGAPYLIATYADEDAGWHAAEGTHRWTNGHAYCPVPAWAHGGSATATLVNYMQTTRNVTLRSNGHSRKVKLRAGGTTKLSIPLSAGPDYLEILSESSLPWKRLFSPRDARRLGIAVREIEFFE